MGFFILLAKTSSGDLAMVEVTIRKDDLGRILVSFPYDLNTITKN